VSVKRARARLDELVVARGLAESRSKAQALILAGRVLVDDAPQGKPGTRVAADAALRVRGAERRYVSRGGEKLAGALAALALAPAGLRCADVGASTGGFTDCLLQRGAAEVLALDVGHGQFAASLRGDPRVTLRERTNVRYYALEPGVAPFDLVVADLSFISLRRVLAPLIALVRPGGQLLCLVKPQFELERGQVGKGGVVRDPALRARAVALVREAAAAAGLELRGEADSVLPGPKGNLERFLLLGRALAADPGSRGSQDPVAAPRNPR
jgi:23S rRNA (cytidine1920-2'-O)/16S rRNA (cytidine1409-2'-O)-methyltransferase